MSEAQVLDFSKFSKETAWFLTRGQDVAKLGYWVWSISTGKVFWSSEMFRIFGVEQSSESLDLEKIIIESIHPDDRERVSASNENVRINGIFSPLKYRVCWKDGTVRHVKAIPGDLEKDENGVVTNLYGIVQDVTDWETSNLLWEYALEGAGDGVWDWDLLGNRVRFSDHAAKMLGYSPAEMPEDPEKWKDLIYPEDRQMVIENIGAYGAGDIPTLNIKYRILCKDGSYKWILDRGKILTYSPQGKPQRMVGTFADISDWVAQEFLLDEACEVGRLGGWRLELPSRQIQWTGQLKRIFGLSKNESPTFDQVKAVLGHDTMARLETVLAQGARNKKSIDAEFEVQIMGQGRKTLVLHGQPMMNGQDVTAFIGIIQDVTFHRGIFRDLETKTQVLEKLLANFPGVLYRYSLARGTVFLSGGIDALWGCAPQTYMLNPLLWEKSIHPDDKALVLKETQNMIEGKLFDMEYRVLAPNGQWRWVNDRAMGWVEVDGEQLIEGVAVDISEKKHIQELYQRNDRLEALSVMTAGLAHDFNNLLSGVFGFLQLAQAVAEPESRISTYLNKAMSVFAKAQGLTQQLMTFSKVGEPKKKILSLEKVLRDNVNFALSGSSIKVDYAIPEDLFPCEADEVQISQIFDNLAINARQAMDGGGSLHITAQNDPHDGRDGVQITFTDSGPGIPPEVIPRIFDPFFTTKKTGNGLGLATCYAIMERHGGSIRVESTIGQGTSFILWLPANPLAQVMTQAIKNSSAHMGTGRLLVLDDEPFILEVVKEMAQDLGYQVVAVRTEDELLEEFKKSLNNLEDFAFVILDLTIQGGEGGLKLGKRLMALNPGVKLVAMSGYSNDPVVLNPKEAGFAGALAKPFTAETFKDLFQRLTSGKTGT